MIKATVLYGHPMGSDAFVKYYVETHMPIAAKILGVMSFTIPPAVWWL